MPITKRVGGTPKPSARPSGLASNAKANTKPTMQKKPGLSLPTEPVPPEEDLESYTLALYGAPKIGKTSFVAEFNDPFFLMFEPGGKGLTIKRVQINGWAETKDNRAVLVKGVLYCSMEYAVDLIIQTDDIKTVVIDTADLAYESCTQSVVSKAGEDSINEGSLGYGKGVDKVDAEFKKQVLRLTSTGRGVVFISHATEKEFQEVTGATYQKILPSMKDRTRRFINGFADIIAYYGYFGADRYLVIQGNDKLDAGHRIPGHFQTPKGLPVHAIPMGQMPSEGFANYLLAYANEQTSQTVLTRKADLGERKIPFKKK